MVVSVEVEETVRTVDDERWTQKERRAGDEERENGVRKVVG